VAETLIGLQLVEIRTLSGGIGISAEGAAEVKDLMGGVLTTDETPGQLNDQPVMDAPGRQAVERVTDALKGQTGNLGLDFDGLSEMMADLKTIEAQLGSARPKTAIIRECLRSIKGLLEAQPENESLLKVKGLLGE
jgi:predicted Zn-dependent protease